jgi:hypothetical protein
MRDLMFMLAPVALILYFVVYPDHFHRSSGGRGSFSIRTMPRWPL